MTISGFLGFLAVYLFGIALCVLVTPVEMTLSGTHLWPWYPLLAIFGLPTFYFYLPQQYVFGSTLGYWLIFWAGLLMIALALLLQLKFLEKVRGLRVYFIAFPLGFVGTLGVYYGAAQSI